MSYSIPSSSEDSGEEKSEEGGSTHIKSPWWELLTKPDNVRDPKNAVMLLIEENKNILLVQGRYGRWQTTGGNIDQGESPKEAAKREFEEEAGVKFSSKHKYIRSHVYNGHTKIYVYMCKEYIGDARFKKKETIGRKWFPINSLPKMRDCDYKSLKKMINAGLLN